MSWNAAGRGTGGGRGEGVGVKVEGCCFWKDRRGGGDALHECSGYAVTVLVCLSDKSEGTNGCDCVWDGHMMGVGFEMGWSEPFVAVARFWFVACRTGTWSLGLLLFIETQLSSISFLSENLCVLIFFWELSKFSLKTERDMKIFIKITNNFIKFNNFT